MKKNIYFLMIGLFALCCSASLQAQVSFTNGNGKLVTPASHSGCPATVVDWNNDGLDDIIHLDQGHICYVEIQITNAQFTRLSASSDRSFSDARPLITTITRRSPCTADPTKPKPASSV